MEQIQSPRMQQEQRHVLRIEQANLLQMSEEEFQSLVAQIEKSSLFKKLYKSENIIHYQRFPKTDISARCYELKENILADEGSLDVEPLLQQRGEVVELIQKIGLEKFKEFFLFPDPEITAEHIAQECNISLSQVHRINEFITDFSAMSEFYHPSAISPEERVHYSKVASIERAHDGFVIGYYPPSLARGRYSINYEKFEKIINERLTEAEGKEARKLFRKLELINVRKDTLTQILQNVVEKQKLYLDTGDAMSLLPLSQKEMANQIGLDSSTVSRTIHGKSVETPWGEEKPIKDFFAHPKDFKKEALKRVFESERRPLSDQAIKEKLEESGILLSRRSIVNLRQELRMPSSRKRFKKQESTK
ncbi:MAG: hypothetical protein ACLFPU_00130 [Dehalococcoidia bacterium]